MLNVIATGVIIFLIGVVGYRAWVRPEDPEPPTGYALGTIRAAQTAIIAGISLVIIGLIVSILNVLL
jgi:hypothetical protein